MKKVSGSRIRTTSFPSVSVLSVLSVVKTSSPLAGLAIAFSTNGQRNGSLVSLFRPRMRRGVGLRLG